MSQATRFEAGIEAMVQDQIEHLHTNVFAKVTSVNYDTGYINAEALISQRYGLGEPLEYPPLQDIPPMVISDGFKANVKMPIKVGATVNVWFAERDPSPALLGSGDKQTISALLVPMGLYPIGWCTVPVVSRGYKLSRTDILIENDKSAVTLTPSTVKVNNATGVIEVQEGAMNLQTTGTISANGAAITPDGNIITASGVNLNDFYAAYLAHKHPVRNVQSGGSTVTSDVPN